MSAPKKIDLNPFDVVKNVITETGKGVGNIGKELTTGINNVSTEIGKGIPQVTGAVGAAADKILKAPEAGLINLERNTAGLFSDLAYGVNTGDYTSFFNRGLAMLPTFAGVPVGAFANPDDITRLTGTKSGETKMRESAEADAKLEVARAAKAEQDARLNAINKYVEGTITTRTRRPGRALTLLGEQGSGGSTLLTRR